MHPFRITHGINNSSAEAGTSNETSLWLVFLGPDSQDDGATGFQVMEIPFYVSTAFTGLVSELDKGSEFKYR